MISAVMDKVFKHVLRHPEVSHDQITDPATKPCLGAAWAAVAVQAEPAKAGAPTKTTAAANINDFTNETPEMRVDAQNSVAER